MVTSSEGAIVVVFRACIARGAGCGEEIKSRAEGGNQAFSLDVAKEVCATWLRGSEEDSRRGAWRLSNAGKWNSLAGTGSPSQDDAAVALTVGGLSRGRLMSCNVDAMNEWTDRTSRLTFGPA